MNALAVGLFTFLLGIVGGVFLTPFIRRRYPNFLQRVEQDSTYSSRVPILTSETKAKMVIAVRGDLGMGKGKIAAQVGHGVLGAFKRAMKFNSPYLPVWDGEGQAKIVVRANSEEELLELKTTCVKAGLNYYLVADAGHTQIASGTYTVIAIGPGPVETVDHVTGDLKLL